jgi:mono/diheme cytochrome c family protein
LLGALVACGDAPRETPADTALAMPQEDTTLGVRDTLALAADTTDSAAATSPARPIAFVLAADSASGDSIFNRRGTCFTCHGGFGAGMPNLGPNLRDAEWLHGDGSFNEILRIITEGVTVPKASPIGMPAFESRLSDTARYRVAAYVYAISHPGSTMLDTTTVAPFDSLSPFSLPDSASPLR